MILALPIRDAEPATPRAHIIRLDLQGQEFPYRAGQAAYVQPVGAAKRRPYSIASAPEETARHGLLEFLVQTDASGISALSQDLIRPGSTATVEGPMGSFVFPAEHPVEQNFLFIAGGTGIAPLRSMLYHALLVERPGRIGLIYSVRSPEEFAYQQAFERLETEKRIVFHPTVTRGASDDWTGGQGRIDATCLNGMIDPGNTLCFVCGPPALVGDVSLQLKQLGVREDQIKLEQWR
jgi:ferredoxin-NADP reductase